MVGLQIIAYKIRCLIQKLTDMSLNLFYGKIYHNSKTGIPSIKLPTYLAKQEARWPTLSSTCITLSYFLLNIKKIIICYYISVYFHSNYLRADRHKTSLLLMRQLPHALTVTTSVCKYPMGKIYTDNYRNRKWIPNLYQQGVGPSLECKTAWMRLETKLYKA